MAFRPREMVTALKGEMNSGENRCRTPGIFRRTVARVESSARIAFAATRIALCLPAIARGPPFLIYFALFVWKSGRSSMAEHEPSKLETRVRFPSPAPPRRPGWRNGSRSRLKICRTRVRAGSSPAPGTILRGRAATDGSAKVSPLEADERNNDWRGVRVVDGATLERLCGRKSTGGSNPPLSANFGA